MLHRMRFTARKLAARLTLIAPLVYRQHHPLAEFRYCELDGPLAPPPVAPAFDDSGWEAIRAGDYWGRRAANFVLRSQFEIPPDWNVEIPVTLLLPLGEAGDFSHPEALLYLNGTPWAACDRHHQEIILPPNLERDRTHSLALHGWVGLMGNQAEGQWGNVALRGNPNAKLLMRQCMLAQVEPPTRNFVALARVALGIADNLDDNNPSRAHLYNTLDAAFKTLDTREPFDDRFYGSVPAAHKTLRRGIARSGGPLDVNITAVGHAHIDVAWLWTLGQTRQKAGRSFYNVIRLMEQFPEFSFTQSQPQLYEFVRQDYPALFAAIKQRVAENRWEPIGGMWVEADCNISGGESLARQFLLGRNYFRRHFGPKAESAVLWLPDVFGYAWNLPQLIREAGLKYFFTIKIGWNEYNRFPCDSFWWQGLDGTRVLTHFSPTHENGAYAATYNAKASPSEALNTWTNFQQKDGGAPGQTPPLLMSFGYGDGGGGPTRQMLENIREMGRFPAAPRVQCGTVNRFFRELETTVGKNLPTWNGELYLENHRGTYTTQARNKRANRKSEFLLHTAEFLASAATVADESYAYPHKELRRAWELVCLNQFHDIIPGSSIGEVYTESLQQYAEVRQLGERVRDNALAAIARQTGGNLLLINPTPFRQNGPIFWPDARFEPTALQRADGKPVVVQAAAGGFLLWPDPLPPHSITAVNFAKGNSQDNRAGSWAVSANLLENNSLRVEVDANGDIMRIYDKVNRREVLPPGAMANQLQLFEDRPKNPDAWDIDIYFDDKMWLADPADSVRVVENGPLRGAIEVRRRIFNSEIVQRISLTHNSPRLDFETEIQWRERHMLLKAAFPVDVLAPTATYEIQWGNVQRPTHRNTSWDWARFETCAQKWVDLSEGGYGVSLLNDCKYGHDIQGNVIRLSLLRGSTNPDPDADRGEHRFAYSLLPHSGGWDERTVAAAYALNNPLFVYAPAAGCPPVGAAPKAFIDVDLPNVVIETIKQAEDGAGIIVRMYESQRRREKVTLTAAFSLTGAWRTNLLEENQAQLTIEENKVRFEIKPYQIVTLRLLSRQSYFDR